MPLLAGYTAGLGVTGREPASCCISGSAQSDPTVHLGNVPTSTATITHSCDSVLVSCETAADVHAPCDRAEPLTVNTHKKLFVILEQVWQQHNRGQRNNQQVLWELLGQAEAPIDGVVTPTAVVVNSASAVLYM